MAKTWQVILATIAIFVAGLVTGGATALGVVRWVNHHRAMNPQAFNQAGQGAPRPGQMMGFGPQLMRNFASQLNLTDDQRAKIMPIVKRTATELGRDRREVQLKTALAIEKMQDEVEEVLTPEQRTKFEDLVAQQRARLQQFRRGFQQAPAQGEQPAVPGAPK
jgi:Spy/CpxP family protein refolding chaperone